MKHWMTSGSYKADEAAKFRNQIKNKAKDTPNPDRKINIIKYLIYFSWSFNNYFSYI